MAMPNIKTIYYDGPHIHYSSFVHSVWSVCNNNKLIYYEDVRSFIRHTFYYYEGTFVSVRCVGNFLKSSSAAARFFLDRFASTCLRL